jgi:tetratricopeptide (TPR) repeat protein
MRSLTIPAVLFVLALALRLAFVADVRDTVAFRSPLVDAFTYDQSGRAVARDGLGAIEVPYYQPPLYPMLLGGIYAATDGSWLAPRILQAILGAAVVGLVAWLGITACGTRAGIVAGLLLLAYGPAIYFEGELLPTTLVLFANTLALALLVRADQRETGWGPLLAAGLLLGVSSAARPTSLLLAAGAGVWWLLRPGSRRFPGVAAFAVAVLLPILPFTWANVAGGGERVLVSWNGGINFYLGNGADSDSLTAIQPGHAWDRLQVEPLRDGHAKGSDQSRYWYRRGFAEAARDPAAWLGALGRKTLRLLDVRDTPRNTDFEVARSDSRILSWPLPGFGWVAPLALLGFAIRRPDRRWTLLGLAVLAVVVENLAFFVSGRYRLEAVPALCVLGGLGVDRALREGIGGFRRSGLIVAGLLSIVVYVDFLGERPIDATRAAINRGIMFRRAGFETEAERAFRTALVRTPDDPDAHRLLADLELAQGDAKAAAIHYEHAVRGAPDYVSALLGRAQALEKLGRRPEAESSYQRALLADRWSAEAYLNYGALLAIEGRTDEARRAFELGLQIGGDVDPEKFRANLRRLAAGS